MGGWVEMRNFLTLFRLEPLASRYTDCAIPASDNTKRVRMCVDLIRLSVDVIQWKALVNMVNEASAVALVLSFTRTWAASSPG
jgi:hypothetical protein